VGAMAGFTVYMCIEKNNKKIIIILKKYLLFSQGIQSVHAVL